MKEDLSPYIMPLHNEIGIEKAKKLSLRANARLQREAQPPSIP